MPCATISSACRSISPPSTSPRARETGVPSLNAARRQFYAETQDTPLKPYESWYDFALAHQEPGIAGQLHRRLRHPCDASLAATTLEEKRDAAMLLVLGGTDAPADRLDFLNGTGAWATPTASAHRSQHRRFLDRRSR